MAEEEAVTPRRRRLKLGRADRGGAESQRRVWWSLTTENFRAAISLWYVACAALLRIITPLDVGHCRYSRCGVEQQLNNVNEQ